MPSSKYISGDDFSLPSDLKSLKCDCKSLLVNIELDMWQFSHAHAHDRKLVYVFNSETLSENRIGSRRTVYRHYNDDEYNLELKRDDLEG